MSMLAEKVQEPEELHYTELHHTRRQLGWLAHLRTTAGLSPAEQSEYSELVTREEELLRRAGSGPDHGARARGLKLDITA